DAGPPAYNTVDASLWFVHAAHDLAEARAGRLPDDLLDACRGVIAGYRSAGGLARMDRDGLVIAGTEHTALTWMDARREDIVFTPRGGKPVEINALWHHALHCVAALVDDETEQAELRELAGRAAIAFQMGFWWPERRCCHDVLVRRHDEWVGDGRLRPNQIIAAALRFTPLTDAQRRDIIGTVRDRLLTPYGLRTLDPDDPEYCPRFEGDMFERDAAYHQGTVWPWLIGPYGEAVLRAGRFGDAAKRHVRRVIDPLVAELDGGCLDQVAEVYDADPPHRPGGCAAQAWSVAELRRLVHLAGLPGLGP
ncbi:MAG: amylo-alpha-1,6-glucosidase, partial [Planctomycetota bacterium]